MHLLKHSSNYKFFKLRTQEDHHDHLHRESQLAKQPKKKKIPILKNLHYINDSLWPTKERVQ